MSKNLLKKEIQAKRREKELRLSEMALSYNTQRVGQEPTKRYEEVALVATVATTELVKGLNDTFIRDYDGYVYYEEGRWWYYWGYYGNLKDDTVIHKICCK